MNAGWSCFAFRTDGGSVVDGREGTWSPHMTAGCSCSQPGVCCVVTSLACMLSSALPGSMTPASEDIFVPLPCSTHNAAVRTKMTFSERWFSPELKGRTLKPGSLGLNPASAANPTCDLYRAI